MHLLWLPRPCLLLPAASVSIDSWEAYVARESPNIHLLHKIHSLFLSGSTTLPGSFSNWFQVWVDCFMGGSEFLKIRQRQRPYVCCCTSLQILLVLPYEIYLSQLVTAVGGNKIRVCSVHAKAVTRCIVCTRGIPSLLVWKVSVKKKRRGGPWLHTVEEEKINHEIEKC